MKKISKILLAVVIFNMIVIANVFASEETNLTVSEVRENAKILNSGEYEYVEIEEVTHVNPLYEDVIDEEDLIKPVDAKLLYSNGTDCKTVTEAGNQLREGLKTRTQTMQITYITNANLDGTIYYQIIDEAMKHTGVPTEGDYLLWQYGGWNAKASGNIYAGKYYYTLTFTFTYYTTYEQEKQMDTAVTNLLNSLNLSGTDYEKITKIYDYICKNIAYDYTSAGMLKHTAYAALINKKAVCQGYAALFYRLALENDIDVRLIPGLGNGGAHGWNIVKIEDKYYNVDATWDINFVNRGYRYYLVTDSNFSDHIRDAEYATNEFYKKYPMGTTNYTSAMNEIYKKTTKVIKINNVWRMLIEGVVDYNYTGIGKNDLGTWYLKDGEVRFDYTGTYFDGEQGYIIEGGKVYATVNKNTTEVIKINNIWRMVKNGIVDYGYTGIGTNDLGTWLIEKGKVTFNYTGNYTDADGKTYIIEKSKVRTDCTEVVKVNNIWRMVINGIVDYNYTGTGKNSFGTWYVENGVVDLKYTGTYYEGDKAHIVESSKIYATVNKNGTDVVKVNNIWRMVKNGVVDYNYTGIGKNSLGTWLIEKGKVTFSYTGNYTDADGKTYIIEKSKVRTDCTEVVKVNNIWRMVINGIVDYNYTGTGKNSFGTWYVENGVVDLKYTGTYYEGDKAHIVEGSKIYATVNKNITEVMKINNVWRMVINGKIDYNYTGIGKNNLGTWLIEKGKVTFNYTGNYIDKNVEVHNCNCGWNTTDYDELKNHMYNHAIKGEKNSYSTHVGKVYKVEKSKVIL